MTDTAAPLTMHLAETWDGLYAPLQRSWHAGGDLFNRAPLEYEDTIAIAEYVKNLPRIDADRVAFVGVSHGGEIHGYIFPIRGSDGAYEVAPVQLDAIAELLEYLDDHLRS